MMYSNSNANLLPVFFLWFKKNAKDPTAKEKSEPILRETQYLKQGTQQKNSQSGMQASIQKRLEIKISSIRNLITQVLH